MKIAYLILANNNYVHLNRLIRALDNKDVHYFVHIDKKSPMPNNIEETENLTFIDRINVWWGGWSLAQAVVNLMNEAVKIKADYYILLSGVDYPIRPHKQLTQKLREGGEFINIIKGFQPHKPESRVKYYYFDGCNKRDKKSAKTLACHAFVEAQKQVKVFSKKNYPFENIYHGSTWFALTHDCVSYTLNYLEKNPKFVGFYKTCLCPDESFIQTILGNSAFLDKCKTNLTYTDWSENKSGPATINKKHVELFINKSVFAGVYGQYEPFFARKFNDESEAVTDLIDQKLLAIKSSRP